VTVVS